MCRAQPNPELEFLLAQGLIVPAGFCEVCIKKESNLVSQLCMGNGIEGLPHCMQEGAFFEVGQLALTEQD